MKEFFIKAKKKIELIFKNEKFNHVYKRRMGSSKKFHYFEKSADFYGHMGKGAYILAPSLIAGGDNIYLEDGATIDWDNTIYAVTANFIMKKNSGAAVGLTVITDNHIGVVGEFFKHRGNNNLEGKDVVVDEDVWLGANVTLLAGTHIGRGAIVGAGTVVRGNQVPPYAIIVGNPSKIIGFRFSPEEVILHESKLYPECERLSQDILQKKYEKHFINRIKEIKYFNQL